jgi:hypothetical protein
MNPIQQAYYYGKWKYNEKKREICYSEDDYINDYLCILCSQGDKVIDINNIPYMNDDEPYMATIITYESSPIDADE